jgi:hypothetical protein
MCIPRPDNITLAEDCPVCCWCETPISPTQQTLAYPDGRITHMKCPAPLKGGLVQSPVTGAIGTPRRGYEREWP